MQHSTQPSHGTFILYYYQVFYVVIARGNTHSYTHTHTHKYRRRRRREYNFYFVFILLFACWIHSLSLFHTVKFVARFVLSTDFFFSSIFLCSVSLSSTHFCFKRKIHVYKKRKEVFNYISVVVLINGGNKKNKKQCSKHKVFIGK